METIRGWIYVITNVSMPGLVKIGFSRKDPVLRAYELDSTGIPYSYTVEYDALVEDPSSTEKDIHDHFQDRLENKEWFKCSANNAISEIRNLIKTKIIVEKSYNNTLEEPVNSQKPTPYSSLRPKKTDKPILICAEEGCDLPAESVYGGIMYCFNHWRIRKFNNS